MNMEDFRRWQKNRELKRTFLLSPAWTRELGEAVRKEYDRQCRNIELIASENIVSPTVMAAMGTVLTNKYAEGLPGKALLWRLRMC